MTLKINNDKNFTASGLWERPSPRLSSDKLAQLYDEAPLRPIGGLSKTREPLMICSLLTTVIRSYQLNFKLQTSLSEEKEASLAFVKELMGIINSMVENKHALSFPSDISLNCSETVLKLVEFFYDQHPHYRTFLYAALGKFAPDLLNIHQGGLCIFELEGYFDRFDPIQWRKWFGIDKGKNIGPSFLYAMEDVPKLASQGYGIFTNCGFVKTLSDEVTSLILQAEKSKDLGFEKFILSRTTLQSIKTQDSQIQQLKKQLDAANETIRHLQVQLQKYTFVENHNSG